MKTTQRVKIVTGLKCNIQCVFCYYRNNLNAPNRQAAEIRSDISYAYRHGIREIDFSGGEPTLHGELASLIQFSKSLGIERCSIISNGLRLADSSYMRSLIDAGLDEVLFSLHGADSETHNGITQCNVSFEKISQALRNAVDNQLIIRINTVVNRINYQGLKRFSEMVLEYAPVQVNFIAINDWCFAKQLVDKYLLDYPEMSHYLKDACDILSPTVSAVNVRYIPFCFMQGYEQFVCDHRQVVYDPYEWVPRVRAKLEDGTGFFRYLGILGYGLVMGGAYKGLFAKSLRRVMDDCVVEGLRRWFYVKGDSCCTCRYYELCDGVERTYAAKFGLGELVTCPGERLTDPVVFRKGNKGWCTVV